MSTDEEYGKKEFPLEKVAELAEAFKDTEPKGETAVDRFLKRAKSRTDNEIPPPKPKPVLEDGKAAKMGVIVIKDRVVLRFGRPVSMFSFERNQVVDLIRLLKKNLKTLKELKRRHLG